MFATLSIHAISFSPESEQNASFARKGSVEAGMVFGLNSVNTTAEKEKEKDAQ
jgi:hypothetical protein